MIYTITMNPAVDYCMEVEKPLEADETVRASRVSMRAGGKGINCSIVFHHLGMESTVLGFAGGTSGDFIHQQLKQYSLTHDALTHTEGAVRINVKIEGAADYGVNAPGESVSAQEQQNLLKELNHLTDQDYVMLCGTYAPGTSIMTVYEIADRVNDAGAKLIMDTADCRLEDLNYCRPWLIKPNQKELEALLQRSTDASSLLKDIQDVMEHGASHVLLTLGADGALFCGKEESYAAGAPAVKKISSNGAGDASLAAFVGSYAKHHDVSEALKWSMAAGSAAVESLEHPDRATIEALLDQIQIKKL